MSLPKSTARDEQLRLRIGPPPVVRKVYHHVAYHCMFQATRQPNVLIHRGVTHKMDRYHIYSLLITVHAMPDTSPKQLSKLSRWTSIGSCCGATLSDHVTKRTAPLTIGRNLVNEYSEMKSGVKDFELHQKSRG